MIYKIDVPTPKDTTILLPLSTRIGLTRGKVKKIEVFFPWGCAGLVGIQIIRGTWQIAPLTRGEWLKGNDILLSYNYNYTISSPPIEFVVRSYNVDDTFQHTPFVTVEILRDKTSVGLEQLLEAIK